MTGDTTPRPSVCNAQSQSNRGTPHEPPYPGDSTVVFSMRARGMTAHKPTQLCSIEATHDIASCRECNA